ncbi:hypothetical protein AHIS1_p019 [Acaryochloris phage A-HIS1]|nr:hypothetical protein AHIS1_p019 [Acaryochloris phage A-HIS1]
MINDDNHKDALRKAAITRAAHRKFSRRLTVDRSIVFGDLVGHREEFETLNDLRMERNNLSNNLLILLSGRAQVGKSTIARHLRDSYGFNIVDAGDPLRVIQGFTLAAFGSKMQEIGREATFEYLKENKDLYIEAYEKRKETLKEIDAIQGTDLSTVFRNETIGIAEYIRCEDPEFWPKFAFKLCGTSTFNVGFVQDLAERRTYGELFYGKILDVKLDCIDHGLDDSRKPFESAGLTAVAAVKYRYAITDSLKVAEDLAKEMVWISKRDMKKTEIVYNVDFTEL